MIIPFQSNSVIIGAILLKSKNGRIKWEKEIIEKMILLYCKHNHGNGKGLCSDCRELLAYARKRLDMCKFGEDKTSCGRCSVHCYKPDMRERVRKVMRYVGPRMFLHHPLDAIRHAIYR